jgi:hypothetical protein
MSTYIVATDRSVVLLGHANTAVIFAPVFVRKIEPQKTQKINKLIN